VAGLRYPELLSRLTGKANMLNRHKYVELRSPAWVCDPSKLRQELGLECSMNLKKESPRRWHGIDSKDGFEP